MAPLVHTSSLLFVSNGEIFRGWDALHEHQLKWWKNGTAKATYVPSEADEFMKLDAEDMLTTSAYTSRRTAADGKASTGSFVVTYVWKHLPTGWRIVYGHESWAR